MAEQLRESIDRHLRIKNGLGTLMVWSIIMQIVERFVANHISAFSMYDFEVHLVEEHKIKAKELK